MSSARAIASLSLDFDNKWAYLRAAGRQDWMESTSYLSESANRITELLGELQLPLTVFLVGRDLADSQDCQAVRAFDRLSVWEPANHSLNHLPWMHTMASEEINDEIEITHDRITEVTGRRPWGFRGPGFSCPEEVLRVLSRLNYQYDASIFPTSVAPLARLFFLMKTDLKGEQREAAKKLYGGFSSAIQPNRPYRRDIDDRALWEIPVTVMPGTRLPIHLSYLTYLASFSTVAAKAYFRTTLRLVQWTKTSPSLLLHPPDFMGAEDDEDLAYLPGMKMSRQAKLEFVRWVLKEYSARFDVRCMMDQLRLIDPDVTWEDPSLEGADSSRNHTPQKSVQDSPTQSEQTPTYTTHSAI